MSELYRELAKQRSVSLYKDQEEKLKKLNNNKLALNIIRKGIDLALKEYEAYKEEVTQNA
jgi:hypothetical protein